MVPSRPRRAMDARPALVALVALLVSTAACAQEAPPAPPVAAAPEAAAPAWYRPPAVAERWAPELHSADGWTYTPTFTPDLQTAYFVLWNAPDYSRPATSIQELYVARWSDGAWSEPERVAATAGSRVDWPHITPDGRRLLLSTTKPHDGHYRAAADNPFDDFDLWGADLDAGGVLVAPTLRPLVGDDLNRPKTPENARVRYVHNETAPRTDRAGRLYLWTERLDDGGGRRDVYLAEPDRPAPDGTPRWRRPALAPF